MRISLAMPFSHIVKRPHVGCIREKGAACFVSIVHQSKHPRVRLWLRELTREGPALLPGYFVPPPPKAQEREGL